MLPFLCIGFMVVGQGSWGQPDLGSYYNIAGFCITIPDLSTTAQGSKKSVLCEVIWESVGVVPLCPAWFWTMCS